MSKLREIIGIGISFGSFLWLFSLTWIRIHCYFGRWFFQYLLQFHFRKRSLIDNDLAINFMFCLIALCAVCQRAHFFLFNFVFCLRFLIIIAVDNFFPGIVFFFLLLFISLHLQPNHFSASPSSSSFIQLVLWTFFLPFVVFHICCGFRT